MHRQTIERLAVCFKFNQQTIMKKNLIVMALGVFLSLPCVLCAEEIEIQLVEIVPMGTIEGDGPLDSPIQSGQNPTRPNDFRATIDGNVLNVTIQNEAIPSAQLRVYRQSTQVVNRSFAVSTTEWLTTPGAYFLEIETTGGMLIGNFNVQ